MEIIKNTRVYSYITGAILKNPRIYSSITSVLLTIIVTFILFLVLLQLTKREKTKTTDIATQSIVLKHITSIRTPEENISKRDLTVEKRKKPPKRLRRSSHIPSDAFELIAIVAPDPEYPATAVENNIEGEVVLRFLVDEKGFVQNPEVIMANPEGVFEESALSAIMKYKFVPIRKNNRPVRITVTLPIKFNIKNI